MKINMFRHLFCPLLAAVSVHAATEWDKPTPAPLPTQVQPQLNVAIGPDTEAVTFVNTNSDPFVYTKVYRLKYADPYEIRPYIMAAIRSRRVDTNETKVEAIKYMDGTGMLIVSAEDYRFSDVPNGMSIDQIIEQLDQPGLASEAGRKFFIYYPQYFDAPTLANIVRRVGLMHVDDDVELQGGIDTVMGDTGLNALVFHTTPTSAKTVEGILAEYDTPTSEALISYKIYELESENDGNIGVDFQAWKNGPGADLFAAGARYANGWDFVAENAANNFVKSAHTSYINFNPRWNSRYLDFLVAKSHAKVVTSGTLSIGNRATGVVESITRMPIIVDGEEPAGGDDESYVGDYMTVSWDSDHALSAVDQDTGDSIDITAGYTGALVVGRTKFGNRYFYTLSLDNSGASFIRADGRNMGRTCQAYDVEITDDGETIDDYSSDLAYKVYRDKMRKSSVTEYGFSMTLVPEISGDASIVTLDMANTNLIGFQSDGQPRVTRTELSTKLSLANDGGTFYIGGLQKSALVRSVSKVPYLGDIPGLGWIFSAETETVKRTNLVAVLEVVPVSPDTKVPEAMSEEAKAITEKIDNFGIKNALIDENEYGFDQYLLDPDKDKD